MATIKKKINGSWSTQSIPSKVGIEKTIVPISSTTINITSNGTYIPSGAYNSYSQANVNIPTPVFPSVIEAGDTPVLGSTSGKPDLGSSTYANLASTGVTVRIPRAGTYRFKWTILEGQNSQLYKNGSAAGILHTNSAGNYESYSEDMACNANDTIEVYAQAIKDGRYYYGGLSQLVVCINWEI